MNKAYWIIDALRNCVRPPEFDKLMNDAADALGDAQRDKEKLASALIEARSKLYGFHVLMGDGINCETINPIFKTIDDALGILQNGRTDKGEYTWQGVDLASKPDLNTTMVLLSATSGPSPTALVMGNPPQNDLTNECAVISKYTDLPDDEWAPFVLHINQAKYQFNLPMSVNSFHPNDDGTVTDAKTGKVYTGKLIAEEAT